MSSICLLCCLTRVCESVIRERNEVISHICTWHAEVSRNYLMYPWVEEIGLENYQIFTGVPVNFKQVFNGVPRISKTFSRSREESPSSNGNPVRFGDPNILVWSPPWAVCVCMYVLMYEGFRTLLRCFWLIWCIVFMYLCINICMYWWFMGHVIWAMSMSHVMWVMSLISLCHVTYNRSLE